MGEAGPRCGERDEGVGPLPDIGGWKTRRRSNTSGRHQSRRTVGFTRSRSAGNLHKLAAISATDGHCGLSPIPIPPAAAAAGPAVDDEGLGVSPNEAAPSFTSPDTSVAASNPTCRKSLSFDFPPVSDRAGATALPASATAGCITQSAPPKAVPPSARGPPSAFRALRSMANAELASAHFNAGVAVLDGQSPAKASEIDTAAAAKHYETAAALGHTKAKVNLAQLYFGTDGAAHVSRGRQLLHEACRERDAVALAFVGAAYRTGSGILGVRRDPARAARILRASVKLGNPDAMLQLSLLLSAGDGVERCDREAFDLCRRAAPYRTTAQMRLAQLYREGRGTDADINLSRLYRESARLNGAVAKTRDVNSRNALA
mmetsp:Transcript_3341/g.8217  ORF Transcript_3341/g.8217 Transcript_3341/m.8217 type:complete len:374 (+) Transcript_3341:402-1523(+)